MESKKSSVPSNLPSSSSPDAEEYTVRVVNGCSKKFSVMRFNAGANVDLSSWSGAKMERENNLKEFKAGEEDMPKFGAGSEYGREQREEARRKRYGQRERHYNPEAQPWLLKQGGKQGKTYKGTKDMVNENSRYYMFSQTSDKKVFEAYPVSDWYNFNPVIKYKTFNIDEAEEEFGRRDKTLNYFSLMLKKRLKDAEGGSIEGEEEKESKEEKSKGSKKLKDSLTIMEDDIYLMDSDDDISSDDEGGAEKKKASKISKKTKKAPKRGKQKGSDDEATEESDEGDFDGREMDYLSETSSDEEDKDPLSEKNNIKGIDEKSSESEEEEEEVKQPENEQNKDKTENQENGQNITDKKKEDYFSSSDSGSDSDSSNEDFDNENSALLVQKKKVETFRNLKVKSGKSSPASSNSGSRPGTPQQSSSATSLTRNIKPASAKRKAADEKTPPTASSTSKKARKHSPASSDTAITQELVARYLMRKPMSTKDLLVKLKGKNTGMSKDQIFHTLAEILSKLKPEKKMIHKKAYWSLKPSVCK